MDEIQKMSVAEACHILGLKGQMATISVPAAGRVLGLGRDSSYAAARTGELPVLEMGRLLRVPVVALARKIVGETPAADPEAGSNMRPRLVKP